MAKQSNFSIISIVFTFLYLIVHFIPDLGGADVMGAQWLYASSLDLVVLGLEVATGMDVGFKLTA